MFAAKNREPIGAIYVCQQDFENNDSSVWFAAVQMRYYLSRITSAPFEIVVDDNGDGIYIRFDDTYGDDEFWCSCTTQRAF